MDTNSPFQLPNVSRRTLLRVGASGLAAFGLASLAGCATDGGALVSPSNGASDLIPKRGGVLKIGLIGGGSGEVMSPYTGATMADHARTPQVWDTLVTLSPDLGTVEPSLAEEFSMSDDFLTMTLKLREDVVFHNGKELTAEDVVKNFRAWTEPDNRNYSTFGKKYDADSVVAVDKYTVQATFNQPWARPFTGLAWASYSIWTMDAGDFIGTGPFILESFNPGKSSVMVANPNYWQEGLPYLDRLEILSFNDNDSLINAVRSGEVQGMAQVPFAQVPAFEADSTFNVIKAKSPNNSCFLVRTDEGPFEDVRARKALKLLADRQQLIDVALLGNGELGNDLFGPGLQFFDDSVPVPGQDVDEARSLFKAAGILNQEVSLQTADVSAGMVESAVLFAEQINNTGLLKVNVKKVDPGAFYDPTQLWMKSHFTQTDCAPVPSLPAVYQGRTVVFNETHWEGPKREEFDRLLNSADGVDVGLAQDMWIDAQTIWREENGYLAWNSLNLIDVVTQQVKGIVPHSAEPLGSYRFLNVWLQG
ncbi:ABC transporter substrate-binding protein [Homoserinimonas sp. OAct 916]|uniref:ABC transporter substrate-binding protein n=1 Tax=Homoserinimonas sp. OAct 916 TaxID=2211450 RepID=UPI000DBE5D7C|nr:ABC transporter substrate-binding protein [Homoserinimonas sp. OAct 916]